MCVELPVLPCATMVHTWNDHYAEGFTPWDTGTVEPMLVAFVESLARPGVGRALDVGCGTGGNARWLAERGYDVAGVDVAPLAIDQARARTPAGLSCRFTTLDILAELPQGGPFELVFDRGCFHVFDEPADRERLAAQIAAVLAPEGVWLSLIGSTEGPPRDTGPPRRSLREVVGAIEPHLAIVARRAAEFRDQPEPAKAWICVAAKRAVAAQPSSRHDG